MGRTLRIESLTVATGTTSKTYHFTPGVNAISGPIGSGKSSMLELIKYGLGGRAKVMPAVRDNVRRVTLHLLLDATRLELSRELGGRTVDVWDPVADVALPPWATTNRRDIPKAGEQLLAHMGIPPNLRVPRRRTRPTGETTPISFWDVFRYLYLDQNGIDTAVVGHNDSNLNNKRLAAFELLFGLTSPRLLELATQRGTYIQEAERSRVAAENIRRFLMETETIDAARLDEERITWVRRLDAAKGRLDAARRGRLSADAESTLARRVREMRSQLAAVSEEIAETEQGLARDQAVLAQLTLDEQAVRRGDAAHQTFTGLDFVQCPRCLHALSHDSTPGICILCGNEEPNALPGSDVELKRIRDQREEVNSLASEDAAALDALRARERSLRDELGGLLTQIENQLGTISEPVIDEVSIAARDAAEAQARLESITGAQARWHSYEERDRESTELRRVSDELEHQESLLRAQLTENEEHIEELESLFREIISQFRVPWYSSASIDRRTYLPQINGDDFDLLSVGGARKTLVNLAYHLALLGTSLTHREEVLLPTFLIVDSPRKNVGEGQMDREVVEAVYGRLSRMQALTNEKAMRGTFQLLIADNDVPQSALRWLPNHVVLSYDDPLVPGVQHPGPEQVETLGIESAEMVELE